MGRSLVFALALLSACGRTNLDGGFLSDTSPGDGEQPEPGDSKPDPPEQTPPDEPEQTPPDEPEPGDLPEICFSTRVSYAGATELLLFAPFESERGPFRVNETGPAISAFSPGGTRFAFIDQGGLFLVDSWPPEAIRLDTAEVPIEFAFVDESHLVVNTGSKLELHDLDAERSDPLLAMGQTTSGQPPLYLVRPSPDGRFIAYGYFSGGVHEAWLLDLEAPDRAQLMTLPPGSVIAWFDWAPDSEHLGISVAESGVWLHAYSVATKQPRFAAPFEVHPISFELEGDASIPTFSWSPTGDALHYLYQDVSDDGESDWRLYFVDMSGDVPGPSVRLSEFAERNWASQGYWSPAGDMVAFEAEFAGNTFRAAEFVTRVHGDLQIPEKQHQGEFASVLKQEWSPDNGALYFTAMSDDEVERVYRSDLSGASTLVSAPAADVRGLVVSPDPGCLAYSQISPQSAVVVVDEATGTSAALGAPESQNGNWTANFDSIQASWVTDRTGNVQGLLYVGSGQFGGNALVWTEVHDCVPSKSFALLDGSAGGSIDDLRVSTTPPSGERE